jgi:hypothetical protein
VPQQHRFHEGGCGQGHRRDNNQHGKKQKSSARFGLLDIDEGKSGFLLRWFHDFHNPKELIPLEEVPPEVEVAGPGNNAAPGIKIFIE